MSAEAAYPMYGGGGRDDSDTRLDLHGQPLQVRLDPVDAELTRSVWHAFVIQAIDCRMLCAITGSKALSCSWPPAAAGLPWRHPHRSR